MPNSDHNNLMETMEMNDSFDSSSEDQIPMQRTSRKRISRTYPRRRNNRVGLTSTQLFKSNYRHGFFTLLKLTFIILSIASLILCLALCYNLYSRFEILQKTLDRVQTTNLNTLKEMHEVHEHRIDKDITINRNNITDVMKHLSNLTSDVSVIEGKLNKILQFVQTAPDIAKLPKDVEDLKSAVADIGAKWATDDKEVKITSEKQAQQKVLLDSMDGRIKIIEGNLSDVQDKTNNKFASTIASLQSDMQKLNSAVSNISYLLENLSKSQTKLDSWRSEIDNEINKLKSDKVNVENKTQTVKHVKKVLDSSVTPPNNVQN